MATIPQASSVRTQAIGNDLDLARRGLGAGVRSYTDRIAGIALRRGIGALAGPWPSGRRSSAISRAGSLAGARKRFQTISGLTASLLPPLSLGLSGGLSRGSSAPVSAPGIPIRHRPIGSMASAQNAPAARFASTLERWSAREPLIGVRISDSSRDPRGPEDPRCASRPDFSRICQD